VSAWNRTDPEKARRDKQRADLRAKAPMRAPAIQFNDEGLALFDAGRQGSLI
jgi:hypothetical protein